MATQANASFGDGLRRALRTAHINQAQLARQLQIDPGQVSRWANGRAIPHPDTIQRIEQILGTDLVGVPSASLQNYELYVSAPITGLGSDAIPEHHDSVAQVVAAIRPYVNCIYWPGEQITSATDLVAPDLATERNFKALANCPAYLYLQFGEVIHPSSAMVEFGFALGRRLKTTLIIGRDLNSPFMLNGFGAVAASLNFLPKARIYSVTSAAEAATLIAKNGRELLGLG